MLGVRPVFVLEGEVPDIIKQREIKRRINAIRKGGANDGNIKRSRMNGIIVQCQKFLEALGVGSLKSPGEAESMCARLNAAVVVDGCISQDSDCFLYGARIVYRNFSAACSSKGGGFAVDSYDMVRIQEILGLDREGLVALALLCGCDYQENSDDGVRGVAGIGIETASHLILSLSKICSSVLSRLQSWRSDPYYSKLEEEAVAVDSGPNCIQCGHRGNLGRHDRVGCKGCDYKEGCKVKCCLSSENSLLNMPIEERKLLMLELRVRTKAMAYPGFPSQSIIDEFLAPVPYPIQLKQSDISWDPPKLSSFLEIAETYLGWTREYCLAKFMPLLTRWKVMQGKNAADVLHPNDVQPVSIKMKRVSKGVPCFEVKWSLVSSVLEADDFTTLEPCPLFEKAYPSMALEFINKMRKECQKPRGGTGKKTKLKKESTKVCSCSGGGKKGHICQFLKSTSNIKSQTQDPDCNKLSPAVDSVTKSMKNVSIQDLNTCSYADEHKSDSDDDFDPLELSAIINCIVEGNCGSSSSNHITEDKKTLAKSTCQPSESNNSTLELSKESRNSFSSDELDDIVKPLASRDKCNLKQKSNKVEVDSYRRNMKILCKQLESVNLEKNNQGDKWDEDNSRAVNADTSAMKGQFLEPNFDLGLSMLLQSPQTSSLSKSVDDMGL